MSDELGDFFALPPFKADEALVQLRRQLKELKLQEQPGSTPHRFALKGVVVAELQVVAVSDEASKPVLAAAVVKRPLQRPEWLRHRLDSRDAVRKWLDAFKRQLASWTDDE
jgi:hypothetical protein